MNLATLAGELEAAQEQLDEMSRKHQLSELARLSVDMDKIELQRRLNEIIGSRTLVEKRLVEANAALADLKVQLENEEALVWMLNWS